MRHFVFCAVCAVLSFTVGLGIAQVRGALTPVEIADSHAWEPPRPPRDVEPSRIAFTRGAYHWESSPNAGAAHGPRLVGGQEFVAADGSRVDYSYEEFQSSADARDALHRHARALGEVVEGASHLDDRGHDDGRVVGFQTGASRRAVLYWTSGSRLHAVVGPTPELVVAFEHAGVL
jgi:hypothetical protein